MEPELEEQKNWKIHTEITENTYFTADYADSADDIGRKSEASDQRSAEGLSGNGEISVICEIRG